MLSKLKILITFTTSILLLVNSVVFADPVKRVLHISVAKAALDAGFIQAMVEEYNWIDPYLQIVIQSEGAIQALDQLRNGEADMTITHHEPEEKRLVSQKFGLHRTQLLYSEYALFGPRDMATNFSSSKDIIKILRELASQKVRFLEPSPRGGTYRKIRDLWTAAGVNPNWMGYENTGSSALSTLRQAADVKAFSMAEIGTFQSHCAASSLPDRGSGL